MLAPTLTTKRLALRHFSLEDTAEVIHIWGDPEGNRYMADPCYESAATLAEALGDPIESPIYYFVATLHGMQRVIATCSTGPESDEPATWGLGYALHRELWGQGLAGEMVAALLTFARDNGARQVISPVAQANKASRRVMEKCGFHIDRESSFMKQGTRIVFPSYIYKIELI